MDLRTKEFSVGDWVRLDKAGIWQIYRVIRFKCADPQTGLETIRPLIFAKRFLSNSFRRSFSNCCCHPMLVELLSECENSKLNEFIELNEKQLRAFETYIPKPLDAIYNARIAIPSDSSPENVDRLLSTDRCFNEFEIQPYLRDSGFTDGYPYWTVQFVSPDHAIDDKGFLRYSYLRVLAPEVAESPPNKSVESDT